MNKIIEKLYVLLDTKEYVPNDIIDKEIYLTKKLKVKNDDEENKYLDELIECFQEKEEIRSKRVYEQGFKDGCELLLTLLK